MKNKHMIMIVAGMISFFPFEALAIDAPTYDPIPSLVDADTYTLKFNTVNGATITVIGGPADIAPVTDGEGNPNDGVVEVLVGLAQETENIFSVTAGKDDETSDSIEIIIREGRPVGSQAPRGDTTPPYAPLLDGYQEEVDAGEITLTGSSEAEANIYARRSDETLAGSSRANSQGVFSVKVKLLRGKTNRINISAEDAAGNEGPATQAVFRVTSLSRSSSRGKLPESEGNVPSEKSAEKEEAREHQFVDIRDHWGESYVSALYSRGIINGKSDSRFDPNGEITRAELVKIALNAFGHEVPASVTESGFKDVPADAWFAPYIKVAQEKGIAQGMGGNFKPNDPITRAAALKILFGASGLAELTDVEVGFKDLPQNAWFYPYVASAVGHDIVSGYADNTFRPGNSITRAEVSKIVVKIMELLEK